MGVCPGGVFADLAAAVADGADCIDGAWQLCGDREHVFGAKASTTTDDDGIRVTTFITDTAPGIVLGRPGGLELRHHQHNRVEDRIPAAKAAGLAHLPCHGFDPNAAWLEIVPTAADLVA